MHPPRRARALRGRSPFAMIGSGATAWFRHFKYFFSRNNSQLHSKKGYLHGGDNRA